MRSIGQNAAQQHVRKDVSTRAWRQILGAIIGCLLHLQSYAAGECDPWVAQIVSVQGQVEVTRSGAARWEAVSLNETLCEGDRVRIEALGRAAVLLRNETVLRLDQGTTITFSAIEEDKPSFLDLLKGAVHFITRVPRTLEIRTPFVNAAVEGTEFVVRVEPTRAEVWVLEGQVLASNTLGSLTLVGGEAAVAEAGKAPVRRIVVKPRDAVQWALYYPPLVDHREAAYRSSTAAQAIQKALVRYRQNDLTGAFATLGDVPAARRDPSYLTLRAALLLSVGRVDEARTEIDKVLIIDPNNGTAVALQSIIAVTQNEKEKGLELAQQAVNLEQKSPVPRVALSYAFQASFEIEKALESAQEAVNLSPEDALSWARLAELQLSLGELDRALDSANEAVELDPDLSRTQTVLGFAHLAQIDIDEAKTAFRKAIDFEPAAPLPRLGLGLATIRQGDLDEGTKEIETAAILDPDNSLVRSYLGKAYYEQKRGGLAATEFEIAKELDPNDPTPWFYDAIRKQTTNRPVEALHDIQKAIELNDNRAVYRSRLLLDDDLAARSASLGRIYRDLNFEQLALVEGWKSVNSDPSNYSGHRFLADSYSALPRHEIARVSELLQSQLLQPNNLTPIQPQLAETNLFILEGAGPGDPAFNEFNPLFIRDRLTFQPSLVVGGNGTFGDEVVHSGLLGKYSYSLGQLHFESDGFRENNDLEQDIVAAFGQAYLSPKASLQVELRYNETDNGDLALRFDPSSFLPTLRASTHRHAARIGFRFQPNPLDNIIGSVIYNKQRFETRQRAEFSSPLLDFVNRIDTEVESKAHSAELQYLLRRRLFNLRVGAGHFDEDRPTEIESVVTTTFPPNPPMTGPADVERIDLDTQHTNVYVYSNIKPRKNLTATAGVSFDSFANDTLRNRSKFSPKFGIIWQATSTTTLRGAAFRTVKRSFASNQTIEPTQVGGFNQFFDDRDGSTTKRYGIGVDQEFSPSLFGGAESSWRDIEAPVIQSGRTEDEKIAEQFHRAYVYWTPTDQLALRTEYQFEKFVRSLTDISVQTDPKRIETHRVPISLNYYRSNGFYAGLGATYLDQRVKVPADNVGDGSDDFWIVDASIGYRLPKRWGVASVGVKNLLDKKFRFQDTNVQSTDPLLPVFQPDRTIFVQLTLSFGVD